jgi:hypothetical protein
MSLGIVLSPFFPDCLGFDGIELREAAVTTDMGSDFTDSFGRLYPACGGNKDDGSSQG